MRSLELILPCLCIGLRSTVVTADGTFSPSSRALMKPSHSMVHRGGYAGPGIELNPDFVPSRQSNNTSTTLGDIPDYTYSFETISVSNNVKDSIIDQARSYAQQIHRISPTLFFTSMSCILVFILWQIPLFQNVFQKYFVLSRQNLQQGRLITLLSNAISHVSLTHLVFNLFAFLSFGPQIRQMIRWPLWTLVLGSTIAGSSMYMLVDRRHGGCLGLSAVTLSMVSVYARRFPLQILGFLFMGVIPIRMQASKFLQVLLLWSLVGTFARSNTNIAHAAHLGGILFGIGYYELWRTRFQWQRLVRKASSRLKIKRL